MMALTYHQRTFDLIGVTPRISSQALFWLDRVEQEQGITLPAALRELYAIVCGREILAGAMQRGGHQRKHLLEIPLDRLAEPLPVYLPIAYGVGTMLEYTIKPGATIADPPVYSNYRASYPETQAVRESYREVHTESLSAFIYWLVWDRLTAPYGCWFAHHGNILKIAVVRALERYFAPAMTTRTTTEVIYRFQSDDVTLTLLAEVYNGFEMSPFLHIRAQTAASFRHALERLQRVGRFVSPAQPDNLNSAQILEKING